MNRSIFLPLAVLVLLAVIFTAIWMKGMRSDIASVSSFEECAAAGYPVMESFPEQCRTPDGRTFVREVSNPPASEDMIRLMTPAENESISSPVRLAGEARGTWFFEASFPVDIVDAEGRVIGEGYAEAEADPETGEVNWMTEDFVSWSGTVEFSTSTTPAGTIVLKKANASGLPENDDEVRVPVMFADYSDSVSGTVSGETGSARCFAGGCSGQLCTDDPEAVSTCEFRPEYACYTEAFAVCERQADGECGWTDSASLRACLEG